MRLNYFSLAAFIILLSCTGKPTEQSGIAAEKIRLKDLKGNAIDLDQYRGKAVFINFWATWCGPCIKEMPSIEQAKNILKGREIEFLFASDEPVDRIQNFIEGRNFSGRFVQLENMEELNILALPTTFIINKKGKLVFSETGYREWDNELNIKLLTKIINNNE